MIPKIAHFHWTGRPMSWLRWVSLASFKKFNPDWEIRLHDTPPDIKAFGMLPAHEADWTWWRKLYEFGGFQVATDIVFVKPVPEAWLNCDLNVCFNGEDRIYQFAMLGARAGHSFMSLCNAKCAEIAKSAPGLGYQAMGVNMLKEVGTPAVLRDDGPVLGQPMGALCSYTCDQPRILWEPDSELAISDECIGIHWYGGHDISRNNEWNSSPTHNSAICKLANSVFP